MASQAGITVFSAPSLLPSTVGAGLGALCALLLGPSSLAPSVHQCCPRAEITQRAGVLEEMPQQQEPETLSKLCGILWL